MDTFKWKNKIGHYPKTNICWDILKDMEFVEQNRDRFLDHLDTIACELGVDWWDGEYPIDDVLAVIKNLKGK